MQSAKTNCLKLGKGVLKKWIKMTTNENEKATKGVRAFLVNIRLTFIFGKYN